MSKKLLATTIILSLAITMLSAFPMSKANFYPIPSMQIIGYNPTYPNESNYTFAIDVRISMDSPAIVSISYSLDDSPNITYTNLGYTTWFPISANLPNNHQIYSISENLHNLDIGNHTINAYALDSKGKISSETRLFTVANSLNSNSPTSSHSASPTSVPEFSWLAILPLLVSTLAVFLFLKKRQVKKT